MGALNVSPESFHAGSVHTVGEELVAAALAMVEAGAALIDVGARSTAPYLDTAVSEQAEAERLERAIELLAPKVAVPLSADTARPGPARSALDAGARVINDVSGLRDPAVGRLVSEHGASVILMASPGAGTSGGQPVAVVQGLLAEALERARATGIPEERIVLDPGIGFFRNEAIGWDEWDTRILGGLEALGSLGRPICVAVSRKSFIGAITGRQRTEERLAGSLAATTLAVWNGATLIRTHDVAETVDAVRVAERIRKAARAL
ncbi:MAG: dihydropteroate synthase [Candidatus Rokuibacteriota bacterium]|nr:MAG: dihydropteroate synthase [Candidatus Rokubacteria bacterium]